MMRTETIAKIIGCKSTEVTVIETPEGVDFSTEISITEAKRKEVLKYLKTGTHPLIYAEKYRISITAPTTLADEQPQLLLYLYKCEKLRKLPIEAQGENTVIYCNQIVEADIPILKSDSRIVVKGLNDETVTYLEELGL